MKKIFVLFLVWGLLVSMTACGDTINKETTADKQEEPIEDNVEDDGKDNIEDESAELLENNNESPADEIPADLFELLPDSEYANLKESEGFDFESNGDGTCTLKELGMCEDTVIVIPEKSPVGDTVTKIAENAFYDAENIESIIFAGKRLEIEEDAFHSCEFETLVISGCELTIGESAFSYCDDLESVVIDGGDTEIGSYAFYDCPAELVITYNGTPSIRKVLKK